MSAANPVDRARLMSLVMSFQPLGQRSRTAEREFQSTLAISASLSSIKRRRNNNSLSSSADLGTDFFRLMRSRSRSACRVTNFSSRSLVNVSFPRSSVLRPRDWLISQQCRRDARDTVRFYRLCGVILSDRGGSSQAHFRVRTLREPGVRGNYQPHEALRYAALCRLPHGRWGRLISKVSCREL